MLAGALTFLLPVTVGGGPAGNRRLGNAGVAMMVILPGGGWPRGAAWAAVLAGFGTFPVLAGAALVAGHARKTGDQRDSRWPPSSRAAH